MEQAATFWQQGKNNQPALVAPFKGDAPQPHRVVYTMTQDDILAFQLNTLNAPQVKKFYVVAHLLTIVPGLLGLAYWWQRGIASPTQSLWLLIIFAFFNCYAWLERKRIFEKRVRADAARAREGDGMLGQHTIWFSSQGFIEMTEANLTKRAWSTIQRIAESPQFFQLYCSNAQSFVVPKRVFPSAQARGSFLQTVNRLIEAAKTAPAATT